MAYLALSMTSEVERKRWRSAIIRMIWREIMARRHKHMRLTRGMKLALAQIYANKMTSNTYDIELPDGLILDGRVDSKMLRKLDGLGLIQPRHDPNNRDRSPYVLYVRNNLELTSFGMRKLRQFIDPDEIKLQCVVNDL